MEAVRVRLPNSLVRWLKTETRRVELSGAEVVCLAAQKCLDRESATRVILPMSCGSSETIH
jgi:hypothetical protein